MTANDFIWAFAIAVAIVWFMREAMDRWTASQSLVGINPGCR